MKPRNITVRATKKKEFDRHFRYADAILNDGRRVTVKTKRILGELHHYLNGVEVTDEVTHHNWREYIDETGQGFDPIRNPNGIYTNSKDND